MESCLPMPSFKIHFAQVTGRTLVFSIKTRHKTPIFNMISKIVPEQFHSGMDQQILTIFTTNVKKAQLVWAVSSLNQVGVVMEQFQRWIASIRFASDRRMMFACQT